MWKGAQRRQQTFILPLTGRDVLGNLLHLSGLESSFADR